MPLSKRRLAAALGCSYAVDREWKIAIEMSLRFSPTTRDAGRMHFTEYELTAAVTGAAKSILASKKLRKRGVDVDAEWDTMDRLQRFQLLDAVGSQVLPVLVALPDVEVAPGTRPSYSDRQVQEVVRGLVGDDLGKVQRLVTVKARTALVQTALAHVPPRSADPAPPGMSGEPESGH